MQHVLTTALFAGLLIAAGTSQAGQSGSDRMANGRSIHGVEVVGAQVDHAKTVNIDDRKSLNVICGETVTFRKGDKTFSWKFDSVGHRAVDLRDIAPAGFADKSLMVYISRNEAEHN